MAKQTKQTEINIDPNKQYAVVQHDYNYRLLELKDAFTLIELLSKAPLLEGSDYDDSFRISRTKVATLSTVPKYKLEKIISNTLLNTEKNK